MDISFLSAVHGQKQNPMIKQGKAEGLTLSCWSSLRFSHCYPWLQNGPAFPVQEGRTPAECTRSPLFPSGHSTVWLRALLVVVLLYSPYALPCSYPSPTSLFLPTVDIPAALVVAVELKQGQPPPPAPPAPPPRPEGPRSPLQAVYFLSAPAGGRGRHLWELDIHCVRLSFIAEQTVLHRPQTPSVSSRYLHACQTSTCCFPQIILFFSYIVGFSLFQGCPQARF